MRKASFRLHFNITVRFTFNRQQMIDNEALEGATVDNDNSWSSSLGSRSKSSGYGTVSSTVSRHRRPRMKTSNSKMNFGEATDDVHVCIMCLRAIMNHQVAYFLISLPSFLCIDFHCVNSTTLAAVIVLLATVRGVCVH